ncbi:TOBE domain-containing protein [Sorangium sp. So ce726]|uniref:TOBE domain-containing protein n=1 Tax=Sorangium sp. So ce726 TaxID=3133319 RepID=UPI003F627263
MANTRRERRPRAHEARDPASPNGGVEQGIRGRIQLDKDGTPFLAPRRIDLLQAIGREGSISAAARAVGLSYKAAWDAVDAMNHRAEAALVRTATGGSGGGGAELTEYGKRVVELVRRVEADYAGVLELLDDPSREMASHQSSMRRFAVRTSARNQWLATITRLDVGLVDGEVTMTLGDSIRLVAAITAESSRELALQPGREVYALVKATAVEMVAGAASKPGPNRWTGTVVRTLEEPDRIEVTAEVEASRTVTAVIARRAPHATAMREGSAVSIAIQRNSVTLLAPF